MNQKTSTKKPDDSDAVSAHMDAATALIQCALQRLAGRDRAAYDGVMQCANSGASFRVMTCVSVAGLSEVSVSIVSPSGEMLKIADIEFEAP